MSFFSTSFFHPELLRPCSLADGFFSVSHNNNSVSGMGQEDGLERSRLHRCRCFLGHFGVEFPCSSLCSQSVAEEAAERVRDESASRGPSGPGSLRKNQTRAEPRRLAAPVWRPEKVSFDGCNFKCDVFNAVFNQSLCVYFIVRCTLIGHNHNWSNFSTLFQVVLALLCPLCCLERPSSCLVPERHN